jgi:hypothetical protein
MKITIGDLIQLSIFIISLSLFLRKPVPVYLRFYPVYFFFLMIVDMVMEYTADHSIHNNIILNIWDPLEFSYYFFVIGQLVVSQKAKQRILYIIILFIVFSFTNLIFFQHNDLFNPVNFTIGTVLTVILCIYYFFELSQKTEAQPISRLPGFWIISAILFNAVLIFPIFAMISFMSQLNKANHKTSMIVFNHIDAIFNIISILTYVLYSIGFLCRIRTSKSTL